MTMKEAVRAESLNSMVVLLTQQVAASPQWLGFWLLSVLDFVPFNAQVTLIESHQMTKRPSP